MTSKPRKQLHNLPNLPTKVGNDPGEFQTIEEKIAQAEQAEKEDKAREERYDKRNEKLLPKTVPPSLRVGKFDALVRRFLSTTDEVTMGAPAAPSAYTNGQQLVSNGIVLAEKMELGRIFFPWYNRPQDNSEGVEIKEDEIHVQDMDEINVLLSETSRKRIAKLKEIFDAFNAKQTAARKPTWEKLYDKNRNAPEAHKINVQGKILPR